ncbi:MAG: tetratricopeptide repeat protein [Thermodesulfobacteriota bacterium]
MWIKNDKPFNRTEILDAAGKAMAGGRRKRAIAEYQKLLKVDSKDYVVHGKIAPLLAERRLYSESWSSFKAAGEGYIHKGFVDKAKGVYVQATRHLPYEIEAWKALVRLHLKRGHEADALKTLDDGRRHFRRRSQRSDAICLLRMTLEISPGNFEVISDLANLLVKSGNRDEAVRLLQGLAAREHGHNLRRTRGAMLRVSPSPSSAWQWLRSTLSDA